MDPTSMLGRLDESSSRLRLADIFDLLLAAPSPVRFTAYDGSATGPAYAPIGVHLSNPQAAAYLATAPGSLGMARGYVAGDVHITGIRETRTTCGSPCPS